MSILERIKVLRESHGNISINRLEKEAGLSRGSMAKWDDHEPSYEKVKKVADYFGVSVSDLTGEQQKKPTAESDGPDNPAMEELLELIKDLTEEETALMLARAKKIKESRI